MALAGHHAEGKKMVPAHGTPEALAIDGEAESKSEFDNNDSSDASASADDDAKRALTQKIIEEALRYYS